MTNLVTGRPLNEMVRGYDWAAPCYRNPTRCERIGFRIAKMMGVR